jgi:hypothetical protein
LLTLYRYSAGVLVSVGPCSSPPNECRIGRQRSLQRHHGLSRETCTVEINAWSDTLSTFIKLPAEVVTAGDVVITLRLPGDFTAPMPFSRVASRHCRVPLPLARSSDRTSQTLDSDASHIYVCQDVMFLVPGTESHEQAFVEPASKSGPSPEYEVTFPMVS